MTTMRVLDLGQADLACCQMPVAQKKYHFPAALKRIQCVMGILPEQTLAG